MSQSLTDSEAERQKEMEFQARYPSNQEGLWNMTGYYRTDSEEDIDLGISDESDIIGDAIEEEENNADIPSTEEEENNAEEDTFSDYNEEDITKDANEEQDNEEETKVHVEEEETKQTDQDVDVDAKEADVNVDTEEEEETKETVQDVDVDAKEADVNVDAEEEEDGRGISKDLLDRIKRTRKMHYRKRKRAGKHGNWLEEQQAKRPRVVFRW
eukprot:41951_1